MQGWDHFSHVGDIVTRHGCHGCAEFRVSHQIKQRGQQISLEEAGGDDQVVTFLIERDEIQVEGAGCRRDAQPGIRPA